jgi:hypothetical protein
MSLKAAFKFVINLQGHEVRLQRTKDGLDVTIKMAPSNYFRFTETVEELNVKGNEYVISKDDLDTLSFPKPRRGDTIIDNDSGVLTIKRVVEMRSLGELLGYRVRTG